MIFELYLISVCFRLLPFRTLSRSPHPNRCVQATKLQLRGESTWQRLPISSEFTATISVAYENSGNLEGGDVRCRAGQAIPICLAGCARERKRFRRHRKIPKGTRILSETPIITIYGNATEHYLGIVRTNALPFETDGNKGRVFLEACRINPTCDNNA